MAHKQMRTVRANGTALGFVKATMPDTSEYSASSFHRQAEIDIVDLLTARSRVAAATVRAHVEAFGLGGRQ